MQAHSIGGQLNRRRFIASITAVGASAAGLGVLGACEIAPQGVRSPPNVARIGYLSSGGFETNGASHDAFRQGLASFGWAEGRNAMINWRFAEDRAELYPEFVAELVGLGVDVFVAGPPEAVEAARTFGNALPIVLTGSGDPVASGWAENLAHPGGSVTGSSLQAPQLSAKRLELLLACAPSVRVVALLRNPTSSGAAGVLAELQAAGLTAGVQLLPLDVFEAADIDSAFAAMHDKGAGAHIVPSGPLLGTERLKVLQLAARHRLPGTYPLRDWVDRGGLLSYGPDRPAQYRRAAYYVDRILRGARPGDLPIEQPTSFECVVNLKTAQALGLAIPPHVAAQVTEWVQ